MKIPSFAIATVLLCCFSAFAEYELVPSITDTFDTEDLEINDTEGNVNWLTSYCSPGWTISGGVLKKNEGQGQNEIGTSNYVRLPEKGMVVAELEVTEPPGDTENPEIRFGITGVAGTNRTPFGARPYVYWRDFGGYGRIDSLGQDASEDTSTKPVKYNSGFTKVFYRLEVTATEARIFCSTSSMPDGSEAPTATLELQEQDWSMWNTGAYGYIRIVGSASLDNFKLSTTDAN